MTRNGLYAGTHLTLNSGCMTHSSLLSPHRGASKALNMSFGLLVAPERMPNPMAFDQAWTPLDLEKVQLRFLPVLHLIARKLDSLFWVSSISIFDAVG